MRQTRRVTLPGWSLFYFVQRLIVQIFPTPVTIAIAEDECSLFIGPTFFDSVLLGGRGGGGGWGLGVGEQL